jgi:hypothetical protein
VEEGGDPPGADASYHGIRAIEKVLPPDSDWRDPILPEAYPGQ